MNQLFHNMSDKELAERVRQGDRHAFRAIVERTEKLVIHIINGMVPIREDREDLAQDVYLKAFRNLPGFRYEARLSTWIARITYNACLNHLRKKRLPLLDGWANGLDDVQVVGGDPFSVVSERQLEGILQQAIVRLGPLYSTLITLFHYGELSVSEIAQVTSLPEGTVKSYLYRARVQLRQHLLINYQNKEAL